ncbi:hypothetical protein [Pseudozobellia sp. WGM2]|uniref:hypothetical protein n=1 Tax=Pseudozobellia sp. WGM2 TaxID=2787625 RepID=UPI001ADFB1E8|nr:hypothetical protein [Pseudozobellia sp. WGM2]
MISKEQNRFLDTICPSYLVGLIAVLVILCIHMLPSMDSMLNENNTKISHVFLKSQIDYHNELPPFARRPLTTALMYGLSDLFKLKAGYSFIIVNFTLLFLSGILLFRLSVQLNASRKMAMANMLVYFVSFSIFFAFFPPVFTYDEPLQYCLIFSSLILLFKKKWIWFIVFFTLALVARETSALLVPAMGLFYFSDSSRWKRTHLREKLRFISTLLLPLVFYCIYLLLFMWSNDMIGAAQAEMGSRYSCFLENFESLRNTVESATSLYIVLVPFVYLSVLIYSKISAFIYRKKFLLAFWITVLINTPIVILTAFARESRLFSLPLVFLWPVCAQLFGENLREVFSLRSLEVFSKRWYFLLSFIILSLGNYFFCYHFYAGLGLGDNTFFKEYIFIINLLLLLHIYITTIKSKQGRDLAIT